MSSIIPSPATNPSATAPQEEITLDPRDWEEWRVLAHRAVDDVVKLLRDVRDRPAYRPIPDTVKEEIRGAPLPEAPGDLGSVIRDTERMVLPYGKGNIHPRFFGWVEGCGTAVSVLADLLASGLNLNAAGFEQASTYVERTVIDWLKELVGFPPDSSGLLVSGGSMANVLGLAVARNTMAGYALREDGLQSGRRPLVVYASSETHSSVQKAVELLGVGNSWLWRVAVHADYSIDVDALRSAIASDRESGLQPLAVVGHAGTINSGAVDDLDSLADVCAEQDLWLHVDGAFGAFGWLCEELRPVLRGMDRADSLGFDLHKWMCQTYDAGCLLVRSAEDHRNAFAVIPEYLKPARKGAAAIPPVFQEYGVELSRPFRALKVWMSLKTYGAGAFRRIVAQNVAQARHLATLVERNEFLELAAPQSLNVVCLRFHRPELSPEQEDDLNARIVEELQVRGIAVPSITRMGGRTAVRVAITNHRTRRDDVELLAREIVLLGHELVSSQAASAQR